MSAVIVPFPKAYRAAAPGMTPSIRFHIEVEAITIGIREACEHLAALKAGADEKTSFLAASAALERTLFHTLVVLGCREEDRPLCNLLNVRFGARA